MKSKNQASRKLNRKVLTCALASCMLMATPQVFAQSAAATLRGHVAGNVAAGSTEITATNIATGAVRRTQSSTDGSYALVGLEPGTYTVQAGLGAPQTVTLSVASTATLNLQAAGGMPEAAGGPATTLETVTVTAQVLPEVKTSEVGSTVSLHQIQTIPQSSRNFLEFADAVPGMVFTRDSNGNTSLRGGAQNNSSTNVYIDGVGQKSYVKEGGVAGQFGSQGNPFPQLAIGEYKVITSNYKAEYGQISSAAVTAVTKSGTNDFHGEAFYRYTDDGLRERTVAEEQPGKDKAESEEKEYGFSLGGPIIQDRLHFFVTYEAKRFNTPIAVVPGATTTAGVPFLPADAAAELGPSNLPFEEDLYFGKLDWEATDSDRFELTAQVRDETQRGGVGNQDAPSHGFDTVNKDKRYALKWQHSSDRWYNELMLTHEDSFNNPTPLNFGNGLIYTYTPFGTANDDTIISTGAASPLSAQKKGQKGSAIEDNLTFSDFQWHGDHVIKMGAKYKDIKLYAADALDVNPQFYYAVDDAGASDIPYKAFFTNPVSGLGLTPSVESSAKQLGLYIQDDWTVNDKLTLNLGVRWDYEKNPSYLDFVTPTNVVAALNGPNPDANAPAGQTYAQALALGGIDVNDYISNGHNRSAFKGAWQPRLGFSYDLNADEQHVIHGGIGRAYDRDLYDYLQLEVTKAAMPQPTIWFRDPDTGTCRHDNTPCFDWDPSLLNGVEGLQALQQSTNVGGEVDLLNNNLKAPYSDQFSVGMSNQLGDWHTDATIARILSYDGFVFTLGNRYPNGDFYQNGSQPWGNNPPGFGSLIVGNNGIETRTTQVLLSTEKPYTKESGWSATFAYTYTQAKQNRDINEHYAFDGGTIDDYRFIWSNAAPRHRFVMTGSFDGPWGINFGAKLTLATPTPGNGLACFGQTYENGAPCLPMGGAPAGNGKFLVGGKVWGYRDVDLQATKNFELGNDVTLYARLNVFNLFNYKNYSDLIYNFGADQVFNPDYVSYNETGNITYVPRTVKLELGIKF